MLSQLKDFGGLEGSLSSPDQKLSECHALGIFTEAVLEYVIDC